MSRPEDSPWSISVAQVASRAGQSKPVDLDCPAPSGIGDRIIGVDEGSHVRVQGSFDSIADGLIFNAQITAPVHAECIRCLKQISKDWHVNAMAFFPYNAEVAGRAALRQTSASRDEDLDIVAEDDESEDTYPLSAGSAYADVEALIRDNLVEALPLQPLCREDCLGLCPQCGINLNDNPDHHHDVTDMRWAGLEGLKKQLENEHDD
ncbi:DUF177 domain-containing protein [Bifidobacterium aquikefiricola]|uniref:DUF177 domain-containing protein n=1 Tax=Bifidobacterium aquikefiricola TaxID=3059038 RepID=A0AB39U7Z0_9BIFI